MRSPCMRDAVAGRSREPRHGWPGTPASARPSPARRAGPAAFRLHRRRRPDRARRGPVFRSPPRGPHRPRSTAAPATRGPRPHPCSAVGTACVRLPAAPLASRYPVDRAREARPAWACLTQAPGGWFRCPPGARPRPHGETGSHAARTSIASTSPPLSFGRLCACRPSRAPRAGAGAGRRGRSHRRTSPRPRRRRSPV